MRRDAAILKGQVHGIGRGLIAHSIQRADHRTEVRLPPQMFDLSLQQVVGLIADNAQE